MKIPVWVVVMAGSHEAPVVTLHPTKVAARRMVEHALQHEGIDHWDHPSNGTVAKLPDLPLGTLKQAWEYHFDGACLIEKHEVDIPLTDLGEILTALKAIVAETRGNNALQAAE